MLLTLDQFVNRARSLTSNTVEKYKLGAGGMDPNAPSPVNHNKECDCSGFVCWALKISRQTTHPLYLKFNGGWINTDAIVHDANSCTGFFIKLKFPKVGCLAVYPDNKERVAGHVGIVTEIEFVNTSSNDKQLEYVPTKIIHCSHGNQITYRDAIYETNANVFTKQKDTIYVWYEGVK